MGQPAPTVGGVMSAVGRSLCQADCLLAEDTRPFALASFPSDSADAEVTIGRAVVQGLAGGLVSLSVEGDADVLSSLGADQAIVVSIGDSRTNYRLDNLTSSLVIYRFAIDGEVEISYAILGRDSQVQPGVIRVHQLVNDAEV
jgi:hypothetical protein